MWRVRLAGDTGGRLGVILGPTAVGKTGLAIALVECLQRMGIPAEIISADSRQIFRGMDIGTAKPSAQQRRRARHHLLDVVAPDETLGLAEYLRLAKACLDDCERRGTLPILVGGTGQYLSALLEDWRIPRVPPQEELRARLFAEAEAKGVVALHERLRQQDALAAERIHPHNVRRVVRALEVIAVSGKPFSAQQQRGQRREALFQLGLSLPRDLLHERADARLESMMAAGFLAEVRGLLAKGFSRALPSFSALGYRELAAHLAGECTLEEALANTGAATHHFIRRQLSWFHNHDEGTEWLDWTEPNIDETLDQLTARIVLAQSVESTVPSCQL